jgi:hypothetical protein
MDWTTGVRSPTEAEVFFSSLHPDRLWGAPRFLSRGTGGKAQPMRDANHSPPSSAEVENE